MKIDIRSDSSLYIELNGWTYYIDDSTNEQIMEKWKVLPEIQCPHCDQTVTVQHMNWSAIVCLHCKEEINGDKKLKEMMEAPKTEHCSECKNISVFEVNTDQDPVFVDGFRIRECIKCGRLEDWSAKQLLELIDSK